MNDPFPSRQQHTTARATVDDPFDPATVAHELAALIGARAPDWAQAATSTTWSAKDPDPDYDRTVIVSLGPAHAGPTITGHRSGITTEVRLRGMVDRSEIRQVLDVLTTAGVLPGVAK